MRNMSFMLTTKQMYYETKWVTRRCGWWFLKPGDIVMACEKCQGLKKGEQIVRIHPIMINSATPETLNTITQSEVDGEGFPEMSPFGFVKMFAREMKVCHDEVVNRIAFEHLAKEGV